MSAKVLHVERYQGLEKLLTPYLDPIHLLNLDWREGEKQEMLITDSFAQKSENSINFHLHFKRYMCEKDNGIGSREEWMNIFGAKFAKQNLRPCILHNASGH